MQAKTKSKIKLGVVLVLVVLIAILGLSGSLRVGKYRFYPFADFLKPGLDLGGGVSAEYAAADASAEDLDSQLDSAAQTLRARLEALDLNEATVARTDAGVRVEVPDASGAEEDLAAIGATGHVEIRDADGNAVLEGADLSSPTVGAVYDSESNPYGAVNFTLSGAVADSFAETAAEIAGQTLSVYLDDELIFSSTLEQMISGNTGFIALTNYADYAAGTRAAQRLAAILASGELPLEMETVRVENISPLMGENAGTLVAVALCAALALAVIGLIARYRLPGAAAALGVLVWALLTVILVCELSFVHLSLAGALGLLPGLCMVAGGFALLLERYAREASAGYAPLTALRRAKRPTLVACADMGLVLLLAVAAMYWLGGDAVKNFASALLVSAVCALAVLLVLACFLVGNALRLSDKPYAVKASEKKFSLSPRACAAIPAALVVVALVMQLCGAGLRPGLDLGGGAVARYALGEEYALADVAGAVREAGVDGYQIVKAEATLPEDESADETAGTTDETAGTEAAGTTDETTGTTDEAAGTTDEAGTEAAGATDEAAGTEAADTTDEAAGTEAADTTDETAGTTDEAAGTEAAGTEAADTTDEAAGTTDEAAETGTTGDAAETAATVAAGSMTDVEIRVPGADAAALEAAQEALTTALTARYANARLVSIQNVSAVGGAIGPAVLALLAACVLACVYIAIRFGLSGALAALASCVCDALVAVAVAAIFGWALRVELAFTAAVAFAAVCSLTAGALVLGRYRETSRTPGMARASREEIIARDAPMALGRAASVAVPALLAAVLMLVLGPSPVRAAAVPVLAGALSSLLSATQITGRLWACLGARRKHSK
ncbi:MAG TPA: hypothetical protein IAA52_09610 [Candidatus Pullichristensenella stercorigallinarum]|uniref:Preprotein translocase subunit SecD n=1 Tax=Candidatus Pullichristensenella stercorigallinarum TaxID=2840909 RepID=A0A9D0ZMP7_9FIRM|nr:hypothetical protein [Candidatus Pullichristensenella stercorigallinarum]